MKLFAVAFLGLMACACLVSVQAGLRDLLSGGHDDDDGEKKHGGHYQGGIGKQVVHTLVDGAVDRLGDVAEQRFDNPLMHAAIVGAGHKLKNKAHDKINDFGDEENENPQEAEGEHKKSNFLSKLFRKKRSLTESAKKAAAAGAKAAGLHIMNNTLGLGGKKAAPADDNKAAAPAVPGAGLVSNLVKGAKNLVGAGAKKDEPKKEAPKKEEPKKEEPKKEEAKKEEPKEEPKKEEPKEEPKKEEAKEETPEEKKEDAKTEEKKEEEAKEE